MIWGHVPAFEGTRRVLVDTPYINIEIFDRMAGPRNLGAPNLLLAKLGSVATVSVRALYASV